MDDRPQSITRWLLGFVMPAKLSEYSAATELKRRGATECAKP